VCVSSLSVSVSVSPLFPTAHQKQNGCGKSSATRNCLLPVHPTFTNNFSSYPNDSIELDSPFTSLLLLLAEMFQLRNWIAGMRFHILGERRWFTDEDENGL
jgi:hypothetical protein